MLDSCLDDEERVYWAQHFKATGMLPPTLHVVSRAMCQGPQGIHRAELLALVRVSETFSGIIIHADSASALAAYHQAPLLLDHQLHSQKHLDLILRIRNIPHLDSNLAVKIKAHQEPGALADLDCYMALGNCLADRAANEAFSTCASALVRDWEHHYEEESHHALMLEEYYRYLVALKPVRLQLAHSLASEGLPVQSEASVLSLQEQLRIWRPSPAWRPIWPDADMPSFWHYGTWGAKITSCVVDWLLRCVWPAEEPTTAPGAVGYSWIEATLSLCMWLGGIPPVRRRDQGGKFALQSMPTFVIASAEGVTLSELALQCSTLVSQTIQLAPVDLLPAHVSRQRIRSLYVQGFPLHAYGWSSRPAVPNQQEVQTLMVSLRAERYGTTTWGWLPPEVFSSEAAYLAEVEELDWVARLERLKRGVRLARKFRNG